MARNGVSGKSKFEVTTKLYVGNLPETCKKSDLQQLFEQFGTVAECDIIKNYAFVHFESSDDAAAAVAGLNDSEFEGSLISVELSRSRVRQKPGMGNVNECYRCGKDGHWSKDCPKYPPRGGGRGGRGGYGGRDDYGPPPYGGYRGRGPYDDDPYYDDYYRGRYPPPPPRRYSPYDDPYERRRPLRDPYDRDPYERPPPDYYRRSPPPRDPYYDDPYYSSRRSYPPAGGAARGRPKPYDM